MTLWGVIENLVSDLSFILLAAVLGWLWIRLTRRRQIREFFGVTEVKRIAVYVSNIRVQLFGAIGVTGQKMSYQGSTMAHGEMVAANQLRDLFSFVIPSSGGNPTFLSRLLFSDVAVQVLLSPLEKSELEGEAPFVALGSPAYNIASKKIEEVIQKGAHFRFGVLKLKDVDQSPPYTIHPVASSTDTAVYIYPGATGSYPPGASSSGAGEGQGEVEEEKPSAILVHDVPDITDTRYGFVQRGFEPRTKKFLFYVAGLSEPSTAAAAHYLVTQWRSLHKKYRGDAQFLVMLRHEPPDFRNWSVVFERELNDAG